MHKFHLYQALIFFLTSFKKSNHILIRFLLLLMNFNVQIVILIRWVNFEFKRSPFIFTLNKKERLPIESFFQRVLLWVFQIWKIKKATLLFFTDCMIIWIPIKFYAKPQSKNGKSKLSKYFPYNKMCFFSPWSSHRRANSFMALYGHFRREYCWYAY